MTRIPSLLAFFVLLPVLALAGDSVGYGQTAPAFGGAAFGQVDASGERVVVQLDTLCGLRPGDTSAVLVFFVNGGSTDELNLAAQWQRKYADGGLDVVAISIDPAAEDMAEQVRRASLPYPVLNDKFGIIAYRYGVNVAPKHFLLDSSCKVLSASGLSLDAAEKDLVKKLDDLAGSDEF